jgi:hypothetical protein
MIDKDCDFCLRRPVTWRYPCAPFMVKNEGPDGRAAIAEYRGQWAACDACKPLVDAKDWDRLYQRYSKSSSKIVKLAVSAFPAIRADLRRQAFRMWEAFAKHRRGEPVPIAPDDTVDDYFVDQYLRLRAPEA